jgi:hypothetical protein
MDMIRHSLKPFHLGRTAASGDFAEGIRELAIDPDRIPKWHPARIEDVTLTWWRGF